MLQWTDFMLWLHFEKGPYLGSNHELMEDYRAFSFTEPFRISQQRQTFTFQLYSQVKQCTLWIIHMVHVLLCFALARFQNPGLINWCNHELTHWGRVTHIGISKLTTIGSENGLPPDRRQAIIWTNAGILWIGPLRRSFSEIFIEIETVPFKKMRLKMSSGKWRPFYLGLNVLITLMHLARMEWPQPSTYMKNEYISCGYIILLAYCMVVSRHQHNQII